MIALDQRLSDMKNLTSAEVKTLSANFLRNQFRKGQLLLTPGQNLHGLYYIESGFVQGYITHNYIDETIWVKDGGSFLLLPGLFNQETSHHYIEFLTDATACMLNLDPLLFPDASNHHLLYKLLQQVYDQEMLLSEKREYINHLPQAKDRYQLFKAEFPGIIGQVNNHIIASLLRMSLKHFVRLKSADL